MSQPQTKTWLDSLHEFGASLVSNAQSRLELLAIELHEEKFRLIQIFVWISAIVFTAAMTIAFASLTLVYIFWENARLAVLSGLAGFYGVTLLVIVVAFRRYLARQPRPFTATLKELQNDRTCIHPES